MSDLDYPKWKYHQTKDPRLVTSAEEESALGVGWKDRHGDFDPPLNIIVTDKSVTNGSPKTELPTEPVVEQPLVDNLESSPKKRKTKQEKVH